MLEDQQWKYFLDQICIWPLVYNVCGVASEPEKWFNFCQLSDALNFKPNIYNMISSSHIPSRHLTKNSITVMNPKYLLYDYKYWAYLPLQIFFYHGSSLCIIVHSVINSVLHGKICRNDELLLRCCFRYKNLYLANVMEATQANCPHTKMLLYCFMIRYLWYTLHKHKFKALMFS